MNILVLGSGGREHALAAALADSDQIENLFIAPGNAGTQALATNVDLDILASSDVLAFCQQHDIDVVVVGPEAPLVAGVADDLRAAHIAVFGPGKDAAQLEGSKSFSKAFMQRHNLPTAAYEVCRTREQAQNYLSMHGAPVVVKADGLAAGKGVVVAYDEQTAQNAIDDCFSGRFGQAGDVVVLEELLAGPECSMIAFVADGNAVCLPPSQDHKRAFDGDRGPNTGGMGAYSPVPAVTNSQLQQMQDIMSVAAQGIYTEFGDSYRGVLYGGFMLTETGPKLLEFNVRFGDPETQVLLARLQSDFANICYKVSHATLTREDVVECDEVGITVVLASKGYPGSYEQGKVILGVEEAAALEGISIFHAGTAVNADGELITAGGRVLAVTAVAPTFEQAKDRVYEACDKINFEGKQYRQDIAAAVFHE